jgi:hypothetical protein
VCFLTEAATLEEQVTCLDELGTGPSARTKPAEESLQDIAALLRNTFAPGLPGQLPYVPTPRQIEPGLGHSLAFKHIGTGLIPSVVAPPRLVTMPEEFVTVHTAGWSVIDILLLHIGGRISLQGRDFLYLLIYR